MGGIGLGQGVLRQFVLIHISWPWDSMFRS